MNEPSCRFKPVFRQVDAPELPNKISSPIADWEITYAGESCRVSHIEGFGYIRSILVTREISAGELLGNAEGVVATDDELSEAFGADETYALDPNARGGSQEVKLGFQTRIRPEAMRALSPSSIRQCIANSNREAKEALANGNKAEYDRKMVEVAAARKYLTETTALGGKSRRFPDQISRDVDAVRKAIERAVASIRKRSPALAAYFKKAIRHSGSSWQYVGAEVWDCSPIGDPFSQTDLTWEPEPEDNEVLAIRKSWVTESRRNAATQEILLAKWREKQKAEMSPVRLAENVYRENAKEYGVRGSAYVLERTKEDVLRLIVRSVTRKRAAKMGAWWSV
jgi:hypothetical protein